MDQQKTYYGQQTTLALSNFPFSIHPVQKELIYAMILVKKAAAMANATAGTISVEIKDAIAQACDDSLSGKFDNQFVTPALQGGAGTSMNMNVNEVIAALATEILSKQGKSITIHANDHVNCSQSTNDVNPSALKIACVTLLQKVIETVGSAEAIFLEKSLAYKDVVKLGRTHLQDAIPTTIGAEFGAYAAIMHRHKRHLEDLLLYLYELNLGGTAIGNSINASDDYMTAVYKNLQSLTKLPVRQAENLMSQTSSQTDFVMVSQALVLVTLDLSKIASDIRLLSSGPNGGLGEITLQNLQAGSSIMPGKINPVLPESVNQLYFLVSGNNLTIEQATHGAQLELGVMFPILADRLLSSLKLTTEVINNFMQKCVLHIQANPEKCKEHLEKSTAYATLLTPVLGYDKTSEIVKKAIAQKKTIRQIILENNYLDQKTFDRLTTLK
ncbi:MAG TPA: aspartate ammonia-lyase [Candidatus Saccharimonadales bacterium]|nr:aspartate ammonia-lyase [Candidatus Saccharimonadales bacterium]